MWILHDDSNNSCNSTGNSKVKVAAHLEFAKFIKFYDCNILMPN